MNSRRDEIDDILADLEGAGLSVSPGQADAFRLYLAEVRAWGRKINLVSPRDLDRLARRHLLESFNVLHPPVSLVGARLVDIGSGAGFPGIPLAIWQPDLHLLLVESIRKKAQFLTHVVEKLMIGDRVKIVAARAEDIANQDDYRDQFDLVTARGAGTLTRVVRWAAPFLRLGGCLIAFKGAEAESELIPATKPMGKLDMRLLDVFTMRWGDGSLVLLRRGE